MTAIGALINRHVVSPGAPNFHRCVITDSSDGSGITLLMIGVHWIKWITIVQTPEAWSDGVENSTIAVRSNRDRSAIEPRSGSFCGGIASRRSDADRRATKTMIVARSRRDRGPIVARSRPDRAENHALFEAKFKLIPRGIEATTHAQGITSTTFENRPTNASIGHDLRANFFFKTHVLLLCSSTFDRFVKELSEFRGRSLVHRDLPAFRLNSEGIGAGLITNSSLISSNFPLEFWNSVRKDPTKFTPIRTNWSLILVAIGLLVRFDRLSRGNLSFY